MQVSVRPATEADVSAIVNLWWEMMDFHARVEPRFHPIPQPDAKKILEKHLCDDVLGKEDWCVLVAEIDGQVAGMMIGTLRDPYPVFKPERHGFVSDASVAPDARRSGVGQALFEALRTWFREKGVSHIQLEVSYNNPASRPFWRAMGCTDYMDIMWYDLETEEE
jgi:ribosomal protein S18 acetylase RimI-like enzyme